MSISSEITRISGNVTDALTAISNKGVTVPTGSKSDDLATLIAQIETGGSSGYTRTVVVPEQTVTPAIQNSRCLASLAQPHGILIAGDDYIITLNGIEYWYTCQNMWSTFNFIGEINYIWDGSGEQPYPCAIYDGNDVANLTLLTYNGNAGTPMTVKVEKIELTGSGGGGGSSTLITKNITTNGTYNASDDSADGYSSVTVNVPTPVAVAMNVQTAQSTSRRNSTALGSVTSLTCSTAGTYDVYWACARSSTSGTWGSQLYINGTAYGTENTTFSNHVQTNKLTGVTIPANATVAIYGRSRSGYYIYVPQLTIVQTT